MPDAAAPDVSWILRNKRQNPPPGTARRLCCLSSYSPFKFRPLGRCTPAVVSLFAGVRYGEPTDEGSASPGDLDCRLERERPFLAP